MTNVNYDEMVREIIEEWEQIYSDDNIDIYRCRTAPWSKAVFFIKDDGHFDLILFNGLRTEHYQGYWVADLISVEKID